MTTLRNNLELCTAQTGDYEEYYKIRSEPKNLFWTGYQSPPDYIGFRSWYNERLQDEDRAIYLLKHNNTCVGALHIDYYLNYAAIGYSIKENCEGNGYATFTVREAINIIKTNNKPTQEVKAWINSNNKASIKVVEKNNFIKSKHQEIRQHHNEEVLFLEYVYNNFD